jgi:hypothetical protein
MYNPFQHHTDPTLLVKIAADPSQLVWSWGPDTANMFKNWYHACTSPYECVGAAIVCD